MCLSWPERIGPQHWRGRVDEGWGRLVALGAVVSIFWGASAAGVAGVAAVIWLSQGASAPGVAVRVVGVVSGCLLLASALLAALVCAALWADVPPPQGRTTDEAEPWAPRVRPKGGA